MAGRLRLSAGDQHPALAGGAAAAAGAVVDGDWLSGQLLGPPLGLRRDRRASRIRSVRTTRAAPSIIHGSAIGMGGSRDPILGSHTKQPVPAMPLNGFWVSG
jgi:hypothetical protein